MTAEEVFREIAECVLGVELEAHYALQVGGYVPTDDDDDCPGITLGMLRQWRDALSRCPDVKRAHATARPLPAKVKSSFLEESAALLSVSLSIERGEREPEPGGDAVDYAALSAKRLSQANGYLEGVRP